jgi:hypothetical protein
VQIYRPRRPSRLIVIQPRYIYGYDHFYCYSIVDFKHVTATSSLLYLKFPTGWSLILTSELFHDELTFPQTQLDAASACPRHGVMSLIGAVSRLALWSSVMYGAYCCAGFPYSTLLIVISLYCFNNTCKEIEVWESRRLAHKTDLWDEEKRDN